MGTFRFTLGAAFIVGFSLATSSPLAGQRDSASDAALPQLAGCLAQPVVGVPFSASATISWHPPADSQKRPLTASSRYYRDSSGRIRVEFQEGVSGTRVVVAPSSKPPAFLVDTKTRTLYKFVPGAFESLFGAGCFRHYAIPVTVNRFVGFYGQPIDEEPLGERTLEGWRVTGTRLTLRLPQTVSHTGLEERWVSPELNLVVYSRREDPVIGVVEHRVTNIRPGEPPSELFELDDYEDITPPRFGCWSWDNPYASHFGQPSRCDNYNP
jgi:hypothetical protein